MAAAPPDTLVTEHLPSLVGIVIGCVTPFALVIGWFIKRLIGRLEKDIDKIEQVCKDLDDRVTDTEATCTKVKALHPVNHPGQTI